MDTTLDAIAKRLMELLVINLCDFCEHLEALLDHAPGDTKSLTGDAELQILRTLADTTLDALAGLLIDLLVIILRDFGEHLEALLDHALLEDTRNPTGYVELRISGILVVTTLDALPGLPIPLLVIILCDFGEHLEALLDNALLGEAHNITAHVEW